MPERTFRPPKLVQNEAKVGIACSDKHNRGVNKVILTQAKKLVAGTPISVTSIKSLYTMMAGSQENHQPNIVEKDGGPTAGTIEWSMLGGNDGLMWTRRVLRQEGILKSANGPVSIPEIIDLRFGPYIAVAEVLEKDVEAQLQEAGIASAVVPTDNGSLVFFTAENVSIIPTINKVVGKSGFQSFQSLSQLPDADLSDPVVIDDKRSRIQVLLKGLTSPTASSGFNCHEFDPGHFAGLAGYDLLGNLSINKLFMLVSQESIKYKAEFIKVDDELGLVMGWAIISTIEGEPYFDKQGDHIPDNAMLEASAEFMRNSRIAGDMHDGNSHGRIVFAWPMTKDIAEAFEIDTDTTGLMVAMKPDNDEVLEKFRNGDYTGFSIGGRRLEDELVEEDE